MRAPAQRYVKLEDLNPGDYITYTRRGYRNLAVGSQGTVEKVHISTEPDILSGVLFTNGKIIFDNEGWTYLLIESQAERDATLRQLEGK